MKKTSNKAFTLIELLVVITIIGILATWAVAVYTSQIQKWRDASRITSVNALKWWVEQYYQDDSDYPNTWSWFGWVKAYVPNLPKDPKTGQSTASTSLDYAYNVWEDANGIDNQVYEISSWLENTWNIKSKAENSEDGWNDAVRLEIWIILSGSWVWDILNTNITWNQALTSWISWDPTNNTCVEAGGVSVAAWIDCTTATDWVMVIR